MTTNDIAEPIDEEYNRAWDDETLEVEHWFSMPVVTPSDAALLLCQYNPNEITFDDAKLRNNNVTDERTLVQLQQRFNALSMEAPGGRSLQDWLDFARTQGIKYNPWIDKYAKTTPPENKEVDTKVTETVEQRRSRYLLWFEEEKRTNERGALQRVYQRELKQNPKADRSNIGKDIEKAREDAKSQNVATHWTKQLVIDGKRQN